MNYDARTKKIRRERRMATLAANAGGKEPQINKIEISEKRNQNGALETKVPAKRITFEQIHTIPNQNPPFD